MEKWKKARVVLEKNVDNRWKNKVDKRLINQLLSPMLLSPFLIKTLSPTFPH